ncbi:putative nucleotide-binding protein (sugar kinase/HSP70/actin superfamily) [Hydrogenispora ethanolica]|jgi:predicted nucleotide-binding protein (sugar kinase/HSP70/actin superfamily)|uniref:Putative nucleotide-binding protein (Sugar kinase/HSP70/actin superfamily) n=1 Tax=Hydrogenispora ethanolica TaxID=1082276 RepID=A0A4R1RMB6_HYDET|nr:CoA protein activase [Hydrogenispora ethanolica]TCL67334.1 putative nucleotide-binding protein (sugar kinase/HSP70/actin superfamily) [Hydrogenispora ethanolica]
MKATFPHLGNLYIPCKALLSELGLEPVVPPQTSQRTIALGTRVSPEFACFPFKVNLGNYIEAIESGAECIFMAGGAGPCRFGYYGEVQREILKEAGYHVEFLIFEAPKNQPQEFWKRIKRVVPQHTISRFRKALHIFWLKAQAIDKLDRLVNKIRPLEQFPGAATHLQNRFYQLIDDAALAKDIKQIFENCVAELQTIPQKQAPAPLKVALVGEIYMVLEPRVNFQIERILGEMGIEVKRTIYLTDWILEHLCPNVFKPGWYKQLQFLARPYLQNNVGGHGLETVAHTVEAGINDFQGVIELAPFTCMPEIIAMQVLPAVSRELSIPVLNIIIDEHSAEAGIQTRLEAFIDLLIRKRKSAAIAAELSPSLL